MRAPLHLASPVRDTPHETAHPPIHPFHFRLRTRWLIVTMRPHDTWRQVWENLIFLVRG